MSSLLDCCKVGNIEGVRAAIEAGADTNQIYSYGKTPLIRAIRRKYIEIVELLLANHADVNYVVPGGSTPLL